jgi:hypothetical protein
MKLESHNCALAVDFEQILVISSSIKPFLGPLKHVLSAVLVPLLVVSISCRKQDNPSPQTIAYLTRLAEVVCSQADPMRKNFVFLPNESDDPSFITEQEVDNVESNLKDAGIGAWVLVLGDQESGTYTVYTWALGDDKLRLNVTHYDPKNQVRRIYYWHCEK